MIKTLMCCFILSLSIQLMAQLNCITQKTDSGELQVCHFQTGQKSTVIYIPKANPRWKTFTAYNLHGEVIYQRSYGQRWGSSNVDVRYYPTGALKSARYTMQPDGGIQYTDITSFFTPEGKFDHDENDGTDQFGHRGPNVTFKTSPVVKQAKTSVACPEVPAGSTCFLINNTSDVLNITAQYQPIHAGAFDRKIEPGDTTEIGIYYPNNSSDNALNSWKITVHNKARTGYHYTLQPLPGIKGPKQYVAVYVRNNGIKR